MPSLTDMQRDPQAPKLPNQPLAFALHFIGHYKWAMIFMFLLEAGQAACQILLPYSFKEIINSVESSTLTAASFADFQGPILIFIAFSLGILIFSRTSGAILVMVGPALRRRTRFGLFNYLQAHSHRYFTSNFAGSLSNRISEVAMGVNHSLWTVLFDFWPISISFTITFILMWQAHSTLAIILFSWMAAFVVVSFLLARKCRVLAKDFAKARSSVTGKIVDSVTNISTAKLFARNKFERENLDGFLEHEVSKAKKTFWFMEKMRWFQFTATLLIQVGMISYALHLWLGKAINVGEFAMISSMIVLLVNDVRNLSRRFLEFFEYLGNIADGVDTIVKPHEVVDKPTAKDISVNRGIIQFKDVSFQYKGGEHVFKSFNVTLNHGEKIGLVGFSGSGKTTFVNLLMRFFDIQSGNILIDGHDVRDFTQDSLRENIAMIPQDPSLYHRSLLENIRYGDIHAQDDEVYLAAKRAGAHNFILEMPEGYSSLVGERGVKLSGGQRQRIAIARAMLKKSPILILDEATSALDSVTEKTIQSNLNDIMEGKTVIAVAHRLSTISHLDRILVFHNGEIIEDGSHDELVAQGGHYSNLWKMQAGGFLPTKDSNQPTAHL